MIKTTKTERGNRNLKASVTDAGVETQYNGYCTPEGLFALGIKQTGPDSNVFVVLDKPEIDCLFEMLKEAGYTIGR